ncbi:hypothetical protein [Calidithermus timidus]|jgi:hypothetical protein|uniref:hypothetical protein n=1 Tax=Calidithermus timidus TaxID=307124 RepID=UPI0003718FC6|nr:hypothetical protein [Calidithermus timidus]
MAFEAFELFGKIIINRGQAVKDLDAVEQKAQQVAKTVESAFERMGRTITQALGAVGVAVGIQQLTGYLQDAASQFTEATTAAKVFAFTLESQNVSAEKANLVVDQLADRYGLLKSDLQDATALLLRNGYTVDQVAQALNGALSSAVVKTKGNLGQMRIALENTAQGLATGRSELLEYAGIVTNIGPTLDKYAKSLGKTAEELTEQERATAITAALNAELANDVKVADVMLQGQLKTTIELNKQKQQLAQTIGSFVAPVMVKLYGVANQVVGAANALLSTFTRLDPQSRELAGSLSALLGVVVALTLQKTALGKAVIALATRKITLTGATKGLWAVMQANPITTLVLAVAALAAAYVKFGGPAEEARKRLELIAQGAIGVGKVLIGTGQAIGGFIKSVVESVVALGNAVALAFQGKFAEAGKALREGINLERWAANLEGANKTLLEGVSAVADAFSGKVNPETQRFLKIGEDLYKQIAGLASASGDASNTLTDKFSPALEGTGDAGNKADKGLSAVERRLEVLKARAEENPKSLKAIREELAGIIGTLTKERDALKPGSDEWIKKNKILSQARDLYKEVGDKITDLLSKIPSLGEKLAQFADRIGGPVAEAFKQLSNAVGDLRRRITLAFTPTEAKDRDLIQALFGVDLDDLLNQLSAALQGGDFFTAGGIVEFFRSLLDNPAISEATKATLKGFVDTFDEQWGPESRRLYDSFVDSGEEKLQQALAATFDEEKLQAWLGEILPTWTAELQAIVNQYLEDLGKAGNINILEGLLMEEEIADIERLFKSGAIGPTEYAERLGQIAEEMRANAQLFLEWGDITGEQFDRAIAKAEQLEKKIAEVFAGPSDGGGLSLPEKLGIPELIRAAQEAQDLTPLAAILGGADLSQATQEELEQLNLLAVTLDTLAAAGIPGAAAASEVLAAKLAATTRSLEGANEGMGTYITGLGYIATASSETADRTKELADAVELLETKRKAGLITDEQYRTGLAQLKAQLEAQLATAQEGSDAYGALAEALGKVNEAQKELDKNSKGFWERFVEGLKAALGVAEQLGGRVAGLMDRKDRRRPDAEAGVALMGAGASLASGDVLGAILKLLGPLLERLQPVLGPLFDALAAIGQLLEPLIPPLKLLIPVVAKLAMALAGQLRPAFQLLGWILEKVVVPVFTFVANVLLAIWNAIAELVRIVTFGTVDMRVQAPSIPAPEGGGNAFGDASSPSPSASMPAPSAGSPSISVANLEAANIMLNAANIQLRAAQLFEKTVMSLRGDYMPLSRALRRV